MVSEVNTSQRGTSGNGPAADPRLYLRDEELDRGVALILAGERALGQAMAAATADSDLSAGEWQVLLAIFFGPGRDVSTIRGELGATVPTFARLLGRLDGRGLIAKDRSGRDGRRRVLSLSAAGEARALPVAQLLRERLRQAYRTAGPEAVAGVRSVLEALADRASAEGGEAGRDG